MKKIRIGNTIALTWNINVNGAPHALTGRQLKLYAVSADAVLPVSELSVSGNAISGKIYADAQKKTGIYSLLLIENEGAQDMATIDSCGAFQLMDCTCAEGCSHDGELEVESDTAICRILPVIPVIGENGNWFIGGEDTGKPAFSEAGMSAYDIAVLHGFQGTEEEWLESLKANLAYQDGKAAVCITEIPAVEIRTPEGMPAVHIDNGTFALTRSDGKNTLLVSSVSNKALNIGNAEDSMTLRSLGGNVSIEDASGAKKSIIHEGNIDEYIEAPSSMAFPVFDILTTRSRRDKYKSSNTYNGENWELYDYYPCLRFVGPAPSDPYRWSFLIYFYSHRKNKKYKLLFEIPLSQCEMPEGWSTNAYQTVVLPVSLMRLFWDLFDPTTTTGTNKFHGAGYIPGTIASEWMSVCATGKSISKRSCSVGVTPRAHGAYYSGSFGIRLISVPGQIYGEMHKFKISLFNHPVSILSERSNILRFSIKMHSGNVTQTLR